MGDDELKELLNTTTGFTGTPDREQTIKALTKMGMLVPENTDEDQVLAEWFNAIRNKRKVLQATVLTTYGCNFACTYCVEGEDHPEISMDGQTAYRTSQFLQAKIEKYSPERVDVVFYGGEPLLNQEPIRIIVPQVRHFSEKRGIPFSFRLITNGALLTPGKTDELKQMGLKQVKITVDGTREHHDKRRPYRNGGGTYDTVMKNLEYAAAKVKVHLGGNFDAENADSMISLLDELEKRGLKDQLAMVSFKPIAESVTDIHNQARPGIELRCDYNDPETARIIFNLRKETILRGFKAPPGIGMDLCSMTTNPLMLVIDPRGSLFRCPAFVGYNQFISGTIERGEGDRPPARSLDSECRSCPYVPLCGEGCSFASFIRHGDINRMSCQKTFMEYIVRENIKLNYRLSHNCEG